MRRTVIAAVLGALCGAFFMPAAHAQAFLRNDRFDADIRRAVKLHLPAQDWRMWKAQLAAESRLNPTVRSPVGAEGIAQFMPATFDEIVRSMGRDPKLVNRQMAGLSIEAGAFYMGRLLRQWTGWSGVTGRDAYEHAIASYNCGSGNTLKAWRRCERPRAWDDTVRCLPQVTGKHAAETRTYVVRIRSYYAALLLM